MIDVGLGSYVLVRRTDDSSDGLPAAHLDISAFGGETKSELCFD
jgi:hypothetical protein